MDFTLSDDQRAIEEAARAFAAAELAPHSARWPEGAQEDSAFVIPTMG